MSYELKQAEKINGCPAVRLAVRGWHEIIEAGHTTSDCVSLAWDDSVLWMEHEGEIVAVLTYKAQEWNKTLWICLSFVLPVHRGNGLYSRLYAKAVEIAKEKGMVRVESGISPRNGAMLAAATKNGRRLEYVVYGQAI